MAILIGAATADVVLNAYLAVRAATAGVFEGFDRDTTVGSYLVETVWQAGLLLGIAVAIHLLAPADDEVAN